MRVHKVMIEKRVPFELCEESLLYLEKLLPTIDYPQVGLD
jgi:hypothetical protein